MPPRRSSRSAVLAMIALTAGLSVLAGGRVSAAEDPGTPGQPPDPVTEAQNYSKTLERQAIYDTPAYQAQLTVVSAQNAAAAAAMEAADPERVFPADLCGNGGNGCAGDIRLDDWANGAGTVTPVLFTARSGATISGHVWATKAGPASRPGIVITNGSVQADEEMYWFAAQALAKDGYVVLTFDPQGQGQSDTPGAAPDTTEGVPAQTDGRPFFDGTEDAIDFLLSTPAKPYEPVPSCASGTSHADKQDRRVTSGLDAGFDPAWALLDPSRIGIAGHSYGASGVSYIAQSDPRVKAVVAWDNLAVPDPNRAGTTGMPEEASCVDASQRVVPPVTKPGLGLSSDYFLPPEPNTTVPDPTAKETESLAYTAAGVDSGQVVIRGGSHFDFDWIPTAAFGATLRGADEIAWYTDAWMDKYVKLDPTADARLLTQRWRSDAAEAAVDPNSDGNMFSFYYRSRLDVHLAPSAGGGTFDCENLRDGCAGLVANDGVAGSFDYLSYDTAKDTAGTATGPATPTPSATPTAAAAPTTAAPTAAAPTTAAPTTAAPASAAAPTTRAATPRRASTRTTVAARTGVTTTSAAGGMASAAGASTPRRTLAFTGLNALLPEAAFGLLACAALTRRRRRGR